MLYRISELAQRVSRFNPNNKIDYWIDFINIDYANEILYVTAKTFDSYDSLRHTITCHLSVSHAEDTLVTFSVNEDESNLQFVFSDNIKESLDFLNEEKAFSSELYLKASDYLNSKTVIEEKLCELNIPSNTIQTSFSNSNRLFSNESLSTTPPTPSSEVKKCRM